jgi:hypothetical protein
MGIEFVERFDSLHPLVFFFPAFPYATRINTGSAGIASKIISCSKFVRVVKSL